MSNFNWKSRYIQEVELMTQRTEEINKRAVTKVHKITPEEEALYSRPKYQYTGFIDMVNSLKGGEKNE